MDATGQINLYRVFLVLFTDYCNITYLIRICYKLFKNCIIRYIFHSFSTTIKDCII
nr:MAG TPA: hypothetical protein [Caudoviricetes sp.]